MTLTPPAPAHDVIRRRRESHRPVWNAAIITSALVGAGAVVALATLPAVPTPGHVAEAYLEARFAHDWSHAWALVCASNRAALGDSSAYAENVTFIDDYYSMPSDVDVEIDGLRGAQGPYGSAAAVAITVTSGEPNRSNWESSGEVLVVEERGEFRVCDPGLVRR